MSHWNYRVVKRLSGDLAIHEVHYNDDGEAYAMTEDPATFGADLDEGPEVIAEALAMAIVACDKPVFVQPPDGQWAEGP